MTDIVDQDTRSRMMAGIRGKNTKPEVILRRALHARGLRYRLHASDVVGRPDLVLRRFRAVIFVHGCFWHRHAGCRFTTTPATRSEFWNRKFAANVKRDEAVQRQLLSSGWRVAIVWECALRKPDSIATAVESVTRWLNSNDPLFVFGNVDER